MMTFQFYMQVSNRRLALLVRVQASKDIKSSMTAIKRSDETDLVKLKEDGFPDYNICGFLGRVVH